MHFVFALLTALAAFGLTEEAPSVQTGTYTFSGEITPLSKLRKEIIRAQGEQATRRANELISLGYDCALVPGTVTVCQKLFMKEFWPAALLAQAQADESLLGAIEIGISRGPSAPVYEGSTVREWTLAQDLKFSGHAYSAFNLMSSQGILKVKAGDFASGQALEFVYSPAASTLSRYVTAIVSSANEINEYSGLAVRHLSSTRP